MREPLLKRRLSFDDIPPPPEPSNLKTSSSLTKTELLALLKNSVFEDNFSDGNFDLDESEDVKDVSLLYVVEPNNVVLSPESPSHMSTNIFTAPLSSATPTLNSNSPHGIHQPPN